MSTSGQRVADLSLAENGQMHFLAECLMNTSVCVCVCVCGLLSKLYQILYNVDHVVQLDAEALKYSGEMAFLHTTLTHTQARQGFLYNHK